jgi:hypothetical protein
LQHRAEALKELAARVRRVNSPEHRELLARMARDDSKWKMYYAAIWAASFALALLAFGNSGISGWVIAFLVAFVVPGIVVTILAGAAAHAIVTLSILAAPFRLLAAIFRRLTR